jgi:hypothetical protein
MKALHTITETRVAIGSETVAAIEFLRRRWQQLQRVNEQGKDPAWISLATKAQLEAQLTCFGEAKSVGLSVVWRTVCDQRQYRCCWVDNHGCLS